MTRSTYIVVHMMIMEENPACPKPVLVRMTCTLKTRNLHVSTHITWTTMLCLI